MSGTDRVGKGEDSTADRNTKKVRFKNGSGDSLANMVVDSSPASGVSWKDKFLGGSASNSLDGAANLDLEFEDGDIRRSNLNGIPTIDFSDRITKILIKGMELTVVVKLLGHNIGYGALYKHITSKPTQSFRLMDVANGYYFVRFQCKVDYDAALTQDRNGHDGEEIPIRPLSSETASATKRDVLPTVGEAFVPWMVKGKEIRKGSGSVAVTAVNLSEGLSGCVDECGPALNSGSLGDNNTGQGLGLKAHVSQWVGVMASKNPGPHSDIGLSQKSNGSQLGRLGL
ncbi:hypothetical protein PVK06_045089 [Gossypium arboreum]|uniref:Uncharacterized protein n=1 Tax=Gossypium arboreum TaxID=29729 RepID=A0ABR0MTI8_GOSAR|nr:hypothetical protein PVK06_045089 [Gossypium arboreum]